MGMGKITLPELPKLAIAKVGKDVMEVRHREQATVDRAIAPEAERGRLLCPGLLPDSWIGKGIQQVGQEIHYNISQADHENASLNKIVIAAADGSDGEAADSWPGKNCLRNNGSGKQRAELQAHDRQYRHQGVAQRVFIDHHIL